MRRFILIAVLAATLGGCGHLSEIFSAATAQIVNPIREVDIYRVKNTYAAALELAAEYRHYCWSAPYSVLMADPVSSRVCASRRRVVRTFQRADVKANAALSTAESFVRDHPTISATEIIGAAWDAVTAFKNSIPAK